MNGAAERPDYGYRIGLISSNNVAFNANGNPALITSTHPFVLRSAWITAHAQNNMELEVSILSPSSLIQKFVLSSTAPTRIVFDSTPATAVRFSTSGGIFVIDNLEVQLSTPPLSNFVLASSFHFPSALSVASGDFSGDGRVDLLVGMSNSVTGVLGVGNGAFMLRNPFPVSAPVDGFAVGDLNHDGRLEGIWANSALYSVSFTNTAFTRATVATSGYQGLVALGDFGRQPPVVTAGRGNEIVVGDLNGDGDLDYVVSSNAPNALTVYHNVGSQFSPATLRNQSDESLHGLALGDWDRDGDLDIAAANRSAGQVLIFVNTGSAQFRVHAAIESGLWDSSELAAADFNGDDRLDLLVRGLRGRLTILYGRPGQDLFQPPVLILTPLEISGHTRTTRALTVNDFDGDKTPDLASLTGPHLLVFLNRTPPRLAIRPVAGLVQTEWRTNFARGALLESTDRLGPNAQWVPVQFPPIFSGEHRSVFDGGDRASRFYRLRAP